MSKESKAIKWILLLTFLGIAVVVAIPNFLTTHDGSRTGDVRGNLSHIRATQLAYFAEWKVYVGNQPLTPVADRAADNKKRRWINTTRFSILGFIPEGRVQCSYRLQGPDYPTEAEGFTARAECDFDADGKLSIWTITNRNAEVLHSGAPF